MAGGVGRPPHGSQCTDRRARTCAPIRVFEQRPFRCVEFAWAIGLHRGRCIGDFGFRGHSWSGRWYADQRPDGGMAAQPFSKFHCTSLCFHAPGSAPSAFRGKAKSIGRSGTTAGKPTGKYCRAEIKASVAGVMLPVPDAQRQYRPSNSGAGLTVLPWRLGSGPRVGRSEAAGANWHCD